MEWFAKIHFFPFICVILLQYLEKESRKMEFFLFYSNLNRIFAAAKI